MRLIIAVASLSKFGGSTLAAAAHRHALVTRDGAWHPPRPRRARRHLAGLFMMLVVMAVVTTFATTPVPDRLR